MFNAKPFLKSLTHEPGVYQMLNAQGDIIYVGKARDLKKRVSSYFHKRQDSPKTQVMLAQLATIEVIVTRSEAEALLLENTLIKKHRPRYNVWFRDDKSYPYLHLTQHADYPRLSHYRGLKQNPGEYFGPYPSGQAVQHTLKILRKLFKLRNCTDIFFANRTRPCLQYQIQRCSAPCVGYVTPEQYAQDVRHAKLLLQGKQQQAIDALVAAMQDAAQQLDFERAAYYRDQIADLRKIQEQQYVIGHSKSVDVLAVKSHAGLSCIALLTLREGQLVGQKTYFPHSTADAEAEEVLSAFITQHYFQDPMQEALPRELILNHSLAEADWLAQTLSTQAGRKIKISQRVRGERAKWLEIAEKNAIHALGQELAKQATVQQRLKALQQEFNLPEMPKRIDCFDVSHTQGETTVAACVVFNQEGFAKEHYRRFNITGIEPGDDYAALQQAVRRHFQRLEHADRHFPDILLIDGGQGQINQVQASLTELGLPSLSIIGIAKGVARKPGLETLFIVGQPQPRSFSLDSLALHLLQQIRDEAHRFAITGHRRKREKMRITSRLETIPGIGAKKRRDLLNYFGGWQNLSQASLDDLIKVPGISRILAQRIREQLSTD